MNKVITFGRRGASAPRLPRHPQTRTAPMRLPLPLIGLFFLMALAFFYWLLPLSAPAVPSTVSSARTGELVSGTFDYCDRGQGYTCVIDGDTFRYKGQSIRIADINTPETYRAGCAAEKAVGERATMRMRVLLNQGPFEIAPHERDMDKYGRKLRLVMRDGRSLGMILVREGLAEQWGGRRIAWCG